MNQRFQNSKSRGQTDLPALLFHLQFPTAKRFQSPSNPAFRAAMKKSASANRRSGSSLSLLSKIAISGATVYAVRKLAARKLPSEQVHPEADLRGKVALIVGGSRGLGLALAFKLG